MAGCFALVSASLHVVWLWNGPPSDVCRLSGQGKGNHLTLCKLSGWGLGRHVVCKFVCCLVGHFGSVVAATLVHLLFAPSIGTTFNLLQCVPQSGTYSELAFLRLDSTFREGAPAFDSGASLAI